MCFKFGTEMEDGYFLCMNLKITPKWANNAPASECEKNGAVYFPMVLSTFYHGTKELVPPILDASCHVHFHSVEAARSLFARWRECAL